MVRFKVSLVMPSLCQRLKYNPKPKTPKPQTLNPKTPDPKPKTKFEALRPLALALRTFVGVGRIGFRVLVKDSPGSGLKL